MRSKRVSLTAALYAAGYTAPAFASGDPGVLLIPAGHLILTAVFLVRLRKWARWRQRLLLSLSFFGSLAVAYAIASGTPFSATSHWLAPAMLISPVAVWVVAAVLLQRRSARVA